MFVCFYSSYPRFFFFCSFGFFKGFIGFILDRTNVLNVFFSLNLNWKNWNLAQFFGDFFFISSITDKIHHTLKLNTSNSEIQLYSLYVVIMQSCCFLCHGDGLCLSSTVFWSWSLHLAVRPKINNVPLLLGDGGGFPHSGQHWMHKAML